MQWKGKELVPTLVTRKIVREVQPLLKRFETTTQKMQESFMSHPEVLQAISEGASDTQAIFKSAELMKQFLELQKQEAESLDKLEATYDLFKIAVDYKGFSPEEVTEFQSDANLDTLSKEEVYQFVDLFRTKLSK